MLENVPPISLHVDPMALSPERFAEALRALSIRRFSFTVEGGEVFCSHPALEPLATRIRSDQRDYDLHEGLFFQVSAHAPIIHGAFIHRSFRGQGQGGTRFWRYDRLDEYLFDGIRLSRGMSQKNALAGLWWGGGKGVISCPPDFDRSDRALRQAVFQEYGDFISSIGGAYVTAEDVGTNTEDMGWIFSKTRFITCIPGAFGGSGNPSSATARGVVVAMEAALEARGEGTLHGKRVVVQGVGHVGEVIIELLLEGGAEVLASDINVARVSALREKWVESAVQLRVSARGDLSVLETPCDILCPAATGAVINQETIPKLRCKIICGAANNQLEDPARDDELLRDRGITYLPDFLVNRMGIVNCANEQYGRVGEDPSFERHLGREWDQSVYQTSLRVLERAKREGVGPHQAAVSLADELSQELHPIWGHRGAEIIAARRRDGWATAAD
ncbi:MAG: Glu/Leu/Phe/Val dehydrogenase dimerization domain-containing protein [Myxococcota bacterium]|nr:Glu/Leu/Phe/Val dehydrogenase dimerization domain-containing protein [Myxococcota bacterium]